MSGQTKTSADRRLRPRLGRAAGGGARADGRGSPWHCSQRRLRLAARRRTGRRSCASRMFLPPTSAAISKPRTPTRKRCSPTRKRCSRRSLPEMKARLKEDDRQVPQPRWTVTNTSRAIVKGGQYAQLCRIPRGGSVDEPQVLLDGNKEAEGKSYWDLGATAHSERSQASCLRDRRQGLGALHGPRPRSCDRQRSCRRNSRHARRPRVVERRPDAVLHQGRRASAAAVRL